MKPFVSAKDRASSAKPKRPTKREASVGELCSDRTPDVWSPFGPVEAGPAEVAPLRRRSKKVDPELSKEPSAILCYLRTLIAEHDVLARDEEVGEIHTEPSRQVVVANPFRAELLCLTRKRSVSRFVIDSNRHNAVEHVGHLR
jgi:hypothetical protein